MYKVKVSTMDGFRKTGTFKTLKGARALAHRYVGAHPDISEMFQYAVGAYGDVKVTWSGCTAEELFPAPAEASPAPFVVRDSRCPRHLDGPLRRVPRLILARRLLRSKSP